MAAVPAWLAAAEALLDRGLLGSARGAAVARRLEGTALGIEIDGLMQLRASVAGGRLALDNPVAPTPATATISGSPFALLQLLRGGARRAPGTTAARVSGDAEVAQLYRELFALGRPDIEEELSRLVGDLPARGVSRFARKALSWAQQVRHTAGENIAEYLQEESRDLVNKTELEEFLRGVDGVRETADRIEARLTNLENRLRGTR
jgi:ubiquinone biosynthesis protein UbiJ